jgi:hypothetical protein
MVENYCFANAIDDQQQSMHDHLQRPVLQGVFVPSSPLTEDDALFCVVCSEFALSYTRNRAIISNSQVGQSWPPRRGEALPEGIRGEGAVTPAMELRSKFDRLATKCPNKSARFFRFCDMGDTQRCT